jgi:hypothetical protein
MKKLSTPPASSMQQPAPAALLKQSHIKFHTKGKRLVENPPQEEEKKLDSPPSSIPTKKLDSPP